MSSLLPFQRLGDVTLAPVLSPNACLAPHVAQPVACIAPRWPQQLDVLAKINEYNQTYDAFNATYNYNNSASGTTENVTQTAVDFQSFVNALPSGTAMSMIAYWGHGASARSSLPVFIRNENKRAITA